MFDVCIYENRHYRPLATQGVTLKVYNRWRACKLEVMDQEIADKINRLSEAFWPGTHSVEEMKNIGAYLYRWSRNPCTAVVDRLTDTISCLDAFLERHQMDYLLSISAPGRISPSPPPSLPSPPPNPLSPPPMLSPPPPPPPMLPPPSKDVCEYEELPTEPVPKLRLHHWKKCQKIKSVPLYRDKLMHLRNILFENDYKWWLYSEQDFRNMDRFYARWSRDICTMALDYLTEKISCMDAFLQKHYTLVSAVSERKPTFLSPDCLEITGVCDDSPNTVSILVRKLKAFESILKACSYTEALCADVLTEVQDMQLFLRTRDPCSDPWLKLLLSLNKRENGELKCLYRTIHTVHAIALASASPSPPPFPPPPPSPPPPPPPPPPESELCWESDYGSVKQCTAYWKKDGIYKYNRAHSLLLESAQKTRVCVYECAAFHRYSTYAISMLLSGKNLCKDKLTRNLFLPTSDGSLCLDTFVESVRSATSSNWTTTTEASPPPPPLFPAEARIAPSLFVAYLGVWLVSVLVGFFCCHSSSSTPSRIGHPRVRWRRGRLLFAPARPKTDLLL